MQTVVLKLGGTSLTNGFNIIPTILNEYKTFYKIILVFSAFSNVTNLLEKKDLKQVFKIHQEIINKYLTNYKLIAMKKLKYIYDHLLYISKFTEHSHFKQILLSYGEKLSVIIYYYYFLEKNVYLSIVWPEYIICTDNNRLNTFPDIKKTQNRINKFLISKLKNNDIIITTGFVGSDKNWNRTIFSRNGSDLSATLIASCLDSEKIIIYKDVDGIMTSDPRKVKNAKVIPIINYNTLSELSYFGGSILHSKSLIPLYNTNKIIQIKNIFNDNALGTWIVNGYSSTHQIDAITSISDNCMFTIKGKGMNGYTGILSEILSIISKKNINIPFITQASSEQTICFCIKNEHSLLIKDEIKKVFKFELSNKIIEEIIIEKNISIITVIGQNMIKQYGISGKIFTILGNNSINIKAISQGSSEISISFIVDKFDEIKTLNVLHTCLI